MVMTSSGSVAFFTSDRPLAQAAELTSHMKANTPVTTRSYTNKENVIPRVRPLGLSTSALLPTHNQRTLVVLLILLKEEDIDRESGRCVEEGENSDGDKELSRGRVVAKQEDAFFVTLLAGGGIKILLVESERWRKTSLMVCEDTQAKRLLLHVSPSGIRLEVGVTLT